MADRPIFLKLNFLLEGRHRLLCGGRCTQADRVHPAPGYPVVTPPTRRGALSHPGCVGTEGAAMDTGGPQKRSLPAPRDSTPAPSLTPTATDIVLISSVRVIEYIYVYS